VSCRKNIEKYKYNINRAFEKLIFDHVVKKGLSLSNQKICCCVRNEQSNTGSYCLGPLPYFYKIYKTAVFQIRVGHRTYGVSIDILSVSFVLDVYLFLTKVSNDTKLSSA
jgi:hypothetical protein